MVIMTMVRRRMEANAYEGKVAAEERKEGRKQNWWEVAKAEPTENNACFHVSSTSAPWELSESRRGSRGFGRTGLALRV